MQKTCHILDNVRTSLSYLNLSAITRDHINIDLIKLWSASEIFHQLLRSCSHQQLPTEDQLLLNYNANPAFIHGQTIQISWSFRNLNTRLEYAFAHLRVTQLLFDGFFFFECKWFAKSCASLCPQWISVVHWFLATFAVIKGCCRVFWCQERSGR